MRLRGATCLALATVLAGCSMTSGSKNQGGWGSFFGDPNAHVVGSEANTAISVLVNNEFGDALEPSDRKAAEDAQNRALRARGVGVSVAWQNERTGRSGQVRPGPVYFVNETSCREFTHEMVLNGRVLQARGAACETELGNWQVIG
ncbi:RT0821/Lpp0805 family surface protein [Roseibium sediminicola]|uniref:RT0821/Lpp0805 family surface protein n=1 Tax=Roseibium sediminicola TaxID=2933272 RepID=A0ABT0GQE0_9HYPH|nr:RT0821/Lpp0805 family surface protein [Roseibium sp. CAU 1639]MCK7611633.1 RT0821/Lpp0805 family surface protein [Roseibium sp. CAU 1639]